MSFKINKLLIALVAVVSSYKILSFYFWHDDFSWFYHLQGGTCFSFWPYRSFCQFLDLFYKIFGYSPFPYYLIGILLLITTSFAFFAFAKIFFAEKVSLIMALFFATSYIGVGAFLEAHSPILVLTPLLALLISMTLFKRALRKRIDWKIFLLATLVFAFSNWVSPIRSSTHFFPLAAFIFLFTDLESKKIKLFLIGILGLVFFFSWRGIYLTGPKLTSFSTELNIFLEIKYFLNLMGSIFIPEIIKLKDEIFRTLLGLSFFVLLLSELRKKKQVKLILFSIVWIFFFFLPYGLKTNWFLGNTNRYFLSMFPGVIMGFAVFAKYKYWKHIMLVFIILGIIQSNIFLESYRVASEKRAAFYKMLHENLSDIPQGSKLFFDFPKEIEIQATDFFRVGYYPSEASIATEYAIDMNSFSLIYNPEQESNKEKILTFYYDGASLVNITDK